MSADTSDPSRSPGSALSSIDPTAFGSAYVVHQSHSVLAANGDDVVLNELLEQLGDEPTLLPPLPDVPGADTAIAYGIQRGKTQCQLVRSHMDFTSLLPSSSGSLGVVPGGQNTETKTYLETL